MKKEELVALGLTEEQADKVIAGFGSMIPKSRFDEINDSKKKLEADLADRDKQLEDLKKSAGSNEELQKEIEKLQNENKTAMEKHQAELKQLQINNAVERALTGAKAKNVKAVKALLDLENAELEGETIKGLEVQLKTLQESEDSKFLFDIQPQKQQQQLKGLKPGERAEGAPAITQPSSLAAAIESHLSSQG